MVNKLKLLNVFIRSNSPYSNIFEDLMVFSVLTSLGILSFFVFQAAQMVIV